MANCQSMPASGANPRLESGLQLPVLPTVTVMQRSSSNSSNLPIWHPARSRLVPKKGHQKSGFLTAWHGTAHGTGTFASSGCQFAEEELPTLMRQLWHWHWQKVNCPHGTGRITSRNAWPVASWTSPIGNRGKGMGKEMGIDQESTSRTPRPLGGTGISGTIPGSQI